MADMRAKELGRAAEGCGVTLGHRTVVDLEGTKVEAWAVRDGEVVLAVLDGLDSVSAYLLGMRHGLDMNDPPGDPDDQLVYDLTDEGTDALEEEKRNDPAN